MSKLIQEIVTYCFSQKDPRGYDFSIQLADKLKELTALDWTVKQVSTTSFVKEGKPVMAYTLLIEKPGWE